MIFDGFPGGSQTGGRPAKGRYPVGFAQPRHRAVRIERNGVSVNASVERRESISNASMLVSPRSLCQNALHTLPFLARRGKREQCFSQKTPPKLYQKSFQNRSKIPPKWCQNRGLEVSWGRVGGSWSPAGPKTHPDAF